VNTPLQIGGMAAEQFDPLQYKWSHTPLGKPFDGCIRNVIHNSKLYDLAEPGLFRHSKPGCIPVEESCSATFRFVDHLSITHSLYMTEVFAMS
jgi:hypothetical protein